jgi:hypothetical protein
MAYFEWASDMEIDGGPIDADHQQLVALVNQLHTATTDGKGQEVVEQILNALIAYTVEHLQREERLMESMQFPNLNSRYSWKNATKPPAANQRARLLLFSPVCGVPLPFARAV